MSQLREAVGWYKNEILEKVGFYRMALRFSKVPGPLRRLLWWGTLNMSGLKRSKRFGTLVYPVTVHWGPSSSSDFATDDNAHLRSDRSGDRTGNCEANLRPPCTGRGLRARILRDVEETINGPILAELKGKRC